MSAVSLVLGGDVMTGRGVDQVLAHPGARELREAYVDDARTYVELAEAVSGPVPAPVPDDYPWGTARPLLARATWRVLNLETSVTTSDDRVPGKAVHYRMHPANVGCLTAAGADVWTLANNHVLDFGPVGLRETLDVLHAAGLRTAGAGRDAQEAWTPATVPAGGHHLVVLAVAHGSSGVPDSWAAGPGRPGVALLPDLHERTADRLLDTLDAGSDDVVMVPVHWGGNWGHAVPEEQRRFARRLLDGGVTVVHGHCSHHPRGVELRRRGVVLYGCGDLVDDYEGISGHEAFRPDLRLLYDVHVPDTGPVTVRAVPLRARRLRLQPATREDTTALAATLARYSARFGTTVEVVDGTLVLSGP